MNSNEAFQQWIHNSTMESLERQKVIAQQQSAEQQVYNNQLEQQKLNAMHDEIELLKKLTASLDKDNRHIKIQSIITTCVNIGLFTVAVLSLLASLLKWI